MLGESPCTLTGGRTNTQYFLTILCDIVDYKIHSTGVPKVVKSISTISPISNHFLAVHTSPHVLYNKHQCIAPSDDDVSNRIHKCKYILHNVMREIRRQLLPHEKRYILYDVHSHRICTHRLGIAIRY